MPITNVAFISLRQYPALCRIDLKESCRSVFIFVCILIEYKLGMIDLTRQNKMVGPSITAPAYTLVTARFVNHLLLLQMAALLAKKDMILEYFAAKLSSD